MVLCQLLHYRLRMLLFLHVKVNNGNPSAWWMPPKDCVLGFEHKVAHETNCGLYHDCLINGHKVERACTYPMQYDVLFGECRPYDQVDCGKRQQAKDLCMPKNIFLLLQPL